jgi:RNA polymerase sigma-70 factor (ECF subfamily)
MALTEIHNNYTSIDKSNFEEIYLHYFPRLLRFAREYIISQEDAENIIQDVFLQLWEKRDDLQIHISLTAYLFTLIKNRCIDHLRWQTNIDEGKKQMQENYLLELKMKLYSLEAINQSIISDDHIETIIKNAIDSLPTKCREIFLLHKMEGKKYREIAEELDISINTVENQMSIALRKLREKLKNHLPLFLFLYYF